MHARLRLGLVAVVAAAVLGGAPAAPAADTGKVVGGTLAAPGAWPFMVGILQRGTASRFIRQFCGGSLISPRFVLTAAHCVSEEGDVTPASSLEVFGGSVDLLSGGVVRRVRSVRVNPGYDGSSLAFDSAILELSRPLALGTVPLADGAVPADASLEDQGTPATVMGWGALLGGVGAYPHLLHQATLAVSDQAACATAWGSAFNAVTMLCAAVPGHVKDSCFGDSGGPLVAGVGAAMRQIGIVSFGDGCARAGTADGVYSRVTGLRDWIEQATGPDPGIGRPTLRQIRKWTISVSTRINRNGEDAYWTLQVQPIGREDDLPLYPTEQVAPGAGPTTVSGIVRGLVPGRYRVRVWVTTADGVQVHGGWTAVQVVKNP